MSADYWKHMKEEAAKNIACVTEKPMPTTEDEVKEHLAYTLKHGSCKETAEVIGEVCEWQCAHLMGMETETAR